MANIVRTLSAEDDLAEIWSYIAADNPKAADELLTQISNMFDLICEIPDIGFIVEEVKQGIRCKPVKRNYLIFYQVIEEDVIILRICQAARNHKD